LGSKHMCDVMFLNQIRPLVNPSNKMGRDAAIMQFAISLKLMF
jgi:hypothetical protein